MAGISSKAAGGFESTQKFQGQEFAHNEFSDGSGLEMYEFKYRMHDPQTGRFWQVDPLADKYIYNSTYAFSENKVTSHFELEGLEAVEMNHRDPALNSVPATKEEKENYTSTAGTAFVTGGVGLSIMVALVLQPEIGIPLAVSYLTGVPVSPSPQAIERFVATEVRTAAAASSGTAEETVTLYRGVNKTSPAYGEALEGNVKPRGGSASPAEHNAGNTNSPYTSWTTDAQVAENYALRPNGGGVVLEKKFPTSSLVTSPSTKDVILKQSGKMVNESEVLIKGRVNNANSRIVPFFKF